MKKTLTINLAGSVFHIDEDAYLLLDRYFRSLEEHFIGEPEGGEIVSDIELRISELFLEPQEGGSEILTVEEVEKVINRMGRPEQLDGEAEEAGAQSAAFSSDEKGKKRFFRDPDDKILGGVLSGLACYFNCDTTVLRILVLVLSVCGLFFATLAVYLVLWFIVPEAKTTSDRLSMKGEHVTIENIGKSVTNGFEQVNEYIRKTQAKSRIQRFFEQIITVVGWVIKSFFVCGSVILLPFLVASLLFSIGFLVLAILVLQGNIGDVLVTFPYFDWSLIAKAPFLFVGGAITAVFLAGFPLIVLIHSVMRHFRKTEPLSVGVKIFLLICWLVSVVVAALFLSHAAALHDMRLL